MCIEATATLTEQQLFALFLSQRIEHTTNFGTVAASYTPDEMLRCGGEYGEMEDATNLLADGIAHVHDPEEELLSLANNLETYASQIRTVWRDFAHFKSAHRVEADLPETEPTEPEAREAWEAAWDEWDNNPRYLTPQIREGAKE